MACINCNAIGVISLNSDGDVFKCPRCGYKWTAADEQQNAAYIRNVQRREPATPKQVTPTGENSPVAEQAYSRMSVAELRVLASAKEIDLEGATRKDDIIAALLLAEESD